MSTTPVTKRYKADLNEAMSVLESLIAEREYLETRIAKQKTRVAALTELVQSEDDSPSPTGLVEGITDACRTVLRGATEPLYPLQVKTRVEALGLPPQQNLLASVHTVIRRLVAANEVEEVAPKIGSGPVAYRWAKRRMALREALRGK
jgi:hypothetical protein